MSSLAEIFWQEKSRAKRSVAMWVFGLDGAQETSPRKWFRETKKTELGEAARFLEIEEAMYEAKSRTGFDCKGELPERKGVRSGRL